MTKLQWRRTKPAKEGVVLLLIAGNYQISCNSLVYKVGITPTFVLRSNNHVIGVFDNLKEAKLRANEHRIGSL